MTFSQSLIDVFIMVSVWLAVVITMQFSSTLEMLWVSDCLFVVLLKLLSVALALFQSHSSMIHIKKLSFSVRSYSVMFRLCLIAKYLD